MQNKVLSLQQLVSQPKSLKLLILHIPFPLKIDSLPLYTNLVKLDLSKNALKQFPYLGDLFNLRFILIHENLLDLSDLKGIFKRDKQVSTLCRRILWVTYWGNKNAFLARHFLANQTAALAVDTHMIVPQQRKQSILQESVIPFCEKSDLSIILSQQKQYSSDVPQDEYMRQFWQQISTIRKKYQEIYPIVKIQKLFRGWIYRKKRKQYLEEMQKNKIVLNIHFSAWKLQAKRQLKLKLFLKKIDKSYLLLSLRQKYKKQIEIQLIKKANQAKIRVRGRRYHLQAQIRFYAILSGNLYRLRSLYQSIKIQESKCLYIEAQSWNRFNQFIVPFVQRFNPGGKIEVNKNHGLSLRFLFRYQHVSQQMLKIVSTNFKSLAYKAKQTQDVRNIKNNNSMLNKVKLKTMFRNIHFKKQQKIKMQRVTQKLDKFAILSNGQSIEISSSVRILKDIVRGIYFYNRGSFNTTFDQNINNQRINFISEGSTRIVSSAIKIQKVWKGYIYRKNNQILIDWCKYNRATIRIQRWVRKLPNYKRTKFIFYNTWLIDRMNQKGFYIKMVDYLNLIKPNKQHKLRFLEQYFVPYIDYQKQDLIIFWDKDQLKQGVKINYQKKKNLFYQKFLGHLIPSNSHIEISKYDQKIYKKVSIFNLFHYQTQTSFVNNKDQQYLYIECKTQYECRKRILGILLLSYSFTQQKPIIREQIKGPYLHKYLNIESSPFMSYSKQNLFQNQPSIDCSLKFYYPHQHSSKPIKAEDTFKITFLKTQEIQPIIQKVSQIEKIKQNNINLQNYLITEIQDQELSAYEIANLKIKMISSKRNIKKMIKRRQIKQIRMMNLAQPKFMLDNISSSKDRVNTQPDLLPQQSSKSLLKEPKVAITRVRKSYAQKKIQKEQMDSFTSNFINSGNFIQKQLFYGFRKRIKTEIQQQKQQSYLKVKNNSYASKQKIIKSQKLKLQKIRQKHKIQKETNLNVRMQSQKKYTSLPKKDNNKSIGKRVRVSFAQQCYPISKKTQ